MDIKICLHKQVYTHMHAPTYIISFYIFSEFDFVFEFIPSGTPLLAYLSLTGPVRGSIFF